MSLLEVVFLASLDSRDGPEGIPSTYYYNSHVLVTNRSCGAKRRLDKISIIYALVKLDAKMWHQLLAAIDENKHIKASSA